MQRFAAIDVGTNTVLLVVAERRASGFVPLVERAEITRLGRGVDRTRRLDPDAIAATVDVVARYVEEARALGAGGIACVATSAARDAENGSEFFDAVHGAAGIVPEVVTGDEEARLVYVSAWRDFGGEDGPTLVVLDVGGGSTELTFGRGRSPTGRTSLQLGAVRLTERIVSADPIPERERALLLGEAAAALQALSLDGIGDRTRARLVAVAGTVTTLAAVAQGLVTYDAGRVHGSTLERGDVERLYDRLAALTTAERSAVPGMEPKRADVIVAGCAIVLAAMRATGFERLTVSDRGVRWGLLYDRFDG